MAEQLVELLYQSWHDLDHATEGLSAVDADAQHYGLSRIAWTVGHVGQQVDSWFNVRFAGNAPHALLSLPAFHTGAIRCLAAAVPRSLSRVEKRGVVARQP